MIERVFLGWDQPILPAAARFFAERANEGVLDLKGTVLVVPGSRAGRRLKELLLAEAQARGCRLSPPRLLTSGALPELLYQPRLRPAPPLVVRRAWAETLRGADRSAISELFPHLPGSDDTRGWDRLAVQIGNLQHEVAGGGHDFAAVADACAARELGFDDGARWRILASAQDRYRELLTHIGLADPDLARLEALTAPPIRAEQEICLVGIAELPRITRTLLERTISDVRALVHAPAEEAAAFDVTGCVDPAAWQERTIPLGSDQISHADRPSDQAAELLRHASSVGEECIAEVAIGLPDPRLVPYVEEWFASADVGTHYAGGSAAGRSGPHRLLDAVADYLERPGWEAFAALLRHPDLEERLRRRRGSADGASYRGPGHVDRDFQLHLPSVVRWGRGGTAKGDSIEGARRLLAGLLGRFEGRRSLTEWPEAILALLVETYGGRELHPNDPSSRRTIEVLEIIRAAALAIHRLPPGLAPTTRGADAIRLLTDLTGRETVADEGEQDAIELLGWLEVVMDDAPVVLIAGFNEGFLPESRSADPFLPDQLRTRLGLLDNAGRYARDAFLLTALSHSRRTLRLVAGRLTADGDPLRPSRLALTMRGAELAHAVQSLAATESQGRSLTPPLVARAAELSEFRLPPVQELDFQPPTELRVTDFGAILQNPFRFMLERSLKLESVHDGSREMGGAEFGSFAHSILGRFGDRPEAASSDEGAIARALDRLLDDEAAERFGDLAFPAVHLQIEQLRLRLHSFARWHAKRVADGWRIVLVEGRIIGTAGEVGDRPVGVPFDVDGESVLLTGRIDRVDHHPATNRYAIFDYKTGDRHPDPEEVHRQKRTGEWKDLQLPLYRHLLAGLTGPDGRPFLPSGTEVELGYIAISKELDRIGDEMASWSEADLLTADDAARDAIRVLRAGPIPFDRSTAATWEGDPLGPLLGLRLLTAAGDEAEESGVHE